MLNYYSFLQQYRYYTQGKSSSCCSQRANINDCLWYCPLYWSQ